MNKKVAKKTLTEFRESLQLTNERINGIYKSAPSLRPVRKTKPSTKVRRVSEVDCGNNNYCACKETIITDTARPRWKKVIMDSYKSCPSWSNAAEMQRYEKALSKKRKLNSLERYDKNRKTKIKKEHQDRYTEYKLDERLKKLQAREQDLFDQRTEKQKKLDESIKKMQEQKKKLLKQLEGKAASQIRVSM